MLSCCSALICRPVCIVAQYTRDYRVYRPKPICDLLTNITTTMNFLFTHFGIPHPLPFFREGRWCLWSKFHVLHSSVVLFWFIIIISFTFTFTFTFCPTTAPPLSLPLLLTSHSQERNHLFVSRHFYWITPMTAKIATKKDLIGYALL